MKELAAAISSFKIDIAGLNRKCAAAFALAPAAFGLGVLKRANGGFFD